MKFTIWSFEVLNDLAISAKKASNTIAQFGNQAYCEEEWKEAKNGEREGTEYVRR